MVCSKQMCQPSFAQSESHTFNAQDKLCLFYPSRSLSLSMQLSFACFGPNFELSKKNQPSSFGSLFNASLLLKLQ